MMNTIKTQRLGRTNLKLSQIGLGCWQFSNDIGFLGKMWQQTSQSQVDEVVDCALYNGINWFDTAELYGNGNSERMLAKSLATIEHNNNFHIATKWKPWLRFASNIQKTIDTRLKNLSPYAIDLYQIHFPYGSLSSINQQMHAMMSLIQQKKIKYIGVSNFNATQVKKTYSMLQRHKIPLVANQVEYNLLNRSIETSGMMKLCKALGISIIAHSPLAQGLLTGKFHKNPELLHSRNLTRKLISFKTFRKYDRSRALIKLLKSIADSHGAQVGQIALRALSQLHPEVVFLIPGARNKEQVLQNIQSMNFTLSAREMSDIERESRVFA